MQDNHQRQGNQGQDTGNYFLTQQQAEIHNKQVLLWGLEGWELEGL